MTTAERETQRTAARLKGNKVRSTLAEIRRELRGMDYQQGMRRAAVLLQSPPGHAVESVKLHSLLGAVRQLGQARILGLLTSTGVHSSDVRVRELSPRQREALVWELQSRADYREWQLQAGRR